MITGALLLLLAEALFFHSWPIAAWLILFFIGNAIYFPLVEEKGLEKRFGDEYLKYKARVPRWIPRLRTWGKSQTDGQDT
jgi:protein-S-isoprenylcysteine O-methyltransferase Ste14